jgi:hypothetical protein
LPLKVVSEKDAYRLVGAPGVMLRISRTRRIESKREGDLEKLRGLVQCREFSVRQVGEILGVSSRTALRIVSEASEKQEIVRMGRGRSIRYRFRS